MFGSKELKDLVYGLGIELCGIASIDRFSDSPKGFHPVDIYKECKSVIVLGVSVPPEVLHAGNMIPYTYSASVIFSDLDRKGIELCRTLEKVGISAVPVPCDTPYEYWDAEKSHGMGVLSMRHAGYLAGLGILGKNTLLINREYGNMIYIGAVLVNKAFDPDPMVDGFTCPPKCKICLDACPQKALDGTTVNQALCRAYSMTTTARGFTLYKCNLCRKVCPLGKGKR
jgi:epoxyqueuosine reductase